MVMHASVSEVWTHSCLAISTFVFSVHPTPSYFVFLSFYLFLSHFLFSIFLDSQLFFIYPRITDDYNRVKTFSYAYCFIYRWRGISFPHHCHRRHTWLPPLALQCSQRSFREPHPLHISLDPRSPFTHRRLPGTHCSCCSCAMEGVCRE